MTRAPHLLTASVTDAFGTVRREPVVVRVEGGFAYLELDDGRSLQVDAEELRVALVPGREVRAA